MTSEPWISSAILVVALFRAATAHAQPASIDHADVAMRAYAAGDYKTAATAFAAAHAKDPQPKYLYGLGQAERKLGACEQAIVHFRQFVATSPSPEEIEQAEFQIRWCEDEIARRPPPPPPPPAAPIQEPWYRDWPGNILVGSGAIAATAGAMFLFRASSLDEDAVSAPDEMAALELRDRGHTARLIGTIGVGTGAVLVIGGILRYVFRPAHEPSLGVTAGSNATVITWSSRF